MNIHDQSHHQRSPVKAAAVAAAAADRDHQPSESSNGFPWWRPRRPSLAHLSSNTSSTSTSIISTSSPPQRPPHHKGESCSSANRLLFDGPATAVVAAAAAGGGGQAGGGAPEPQQQFETQEKPRNTKEQQQRSADGRHLWTRGSRDGTEAPSPEEDDDDSFDVRRTIATTTTATTTTTNATDATNATTTSATTAPSLLLPPYNNDSYNNYNNTDSNVNNDSAQRRRRPQQEDVIIGSSSGKLKSLKVAPTATTAVAVPAAATGCSSTCGRAVDSDRPGRPLPTNNTSGGGGGCGGCSGGTSEQRWRRQQQSNERRRRTPSKPPRPEQGSSRYNSSRSTIRRTDNGSVENGVSRGEERETMVVVQVGRAEGGGINGTEEGSAVTNISSSSSSNGAHGMTCKAREDKKAADYSREEAGMDDDTAARVNSAKEPSVVYDILAVDRGEGYCDTSVVPFPMEDGGLVSVERMRGLTSGQSEFLARRGFAAGLVSHFLDETNCEFRVLQGGASCGMNAVQLGVAAVRLEEAFVPAVKRLRGRASVDVVLDSLFQGADDAGEFVVRFEVTITRCHPEDMESSPTLALRECARTIREAVKEERVVEQSMHEVVFVGRPMWELVSPVLDLSAACRVEEKAPAASLG